MYYFASDTHLGAGSLEEQRTTERLFVEWLDRVSLDAEAIFLCGDIFDFWYEYRRVVPKGFVRTLGRLAQLTDRGVRVVFMAGNHDMWIGDYLAVECGVELYTQPTTFDVGAIKVHVAHGDNLKVKKNPMLRFMNSTFRSGLVRWLFTWLVHPNHAMRFGQWWSGSSRNKHTCEPSHLKLSTAVYLREYARENYLASGEAVDLYLFGHVHLVKEYLADESTQSPHAIFMNDWSSEPHYISLDRAGRATLSSVKELLKR